MHALRSPPRQRRTPRLWVRLAIGFGTLQVLMLLVVALAVLQFRELASHNEQVMREDLQRMLRVQALSQHAKGHGGAMAQLLTATRSQRELIYPVIDAEYAAVDGLLKELSASISDPEATSRLARVTAQRSAYRTIFADVATWIEVGDVEGARRLFNDTGQPALTALQGAADALMRSEQQGLASRQVDLNQQIRRSEWLLGALSLVAVLLSSLLAWRTTAGVARPLRRIESAARRIAQGQYTTQVRVRGDDELAQVAQAMNAMAAAVAQRESEIETLAFVDRLTGLPNLARLRLLARELDGRPRALILMDVARLRTVNEALGFEMGDALLLQVAQRLERVTQASVTPSQPLMLARLSGGVFAVLAAGLDRAGLERLRARIDAALTAPVDCGGHAIDVHLVYGLADSGEAVDVSVDDLLRRVELAVSESKQDKRSWSWHVPGDDAARLRQLSLLSDLRSAASQGRLDLWLQPKLCLRSGRMLGLEGLVRWRHERHGLISPDEFISFAERTGHIGVVTRAMLDAALRRLAQWSDQPHLSIAVNVSALDIQQMSFVDLVVQLARQHGAPLQRLRLEITESSLMQDADRVLPVLCALRERGVRLSVDDFGTGYSSLSYLSRFPVDELKIDRSFVANADLQAESRALLRTIIELGHSLNMLVTAEGIERPEELALLTQLGCDQAQGFLISRPLSPQDATQYVADRAAQETAVALA